MPVKPNIYGTSLYSIGGGGGGGSNTVDVQDEGVAVNTASTLNFVGAGVTATDAGGGTATITIPGGSTEGSALTYVGTAGEALSTGAPVRFDTTGTPGEILNGQATTLPAADAIGIVKTGVASGASVTIYTAGNVAVLFGSAPASSSNGSRVYLDPDTAGQATLTLPTASGDAVVLLGRLTGANGVTTTPSVLLSINFLYTIP
jgi:hypothetical protein